MHIELTETQAALVRLAISDFIHNKSQENFTKQSFEDLKKVMDDISEQFQQSLHR